MRHRRTAFTLVELLVASAIFIVVMITVYSAMHTGIFGYRDIEEALDTSLAARQILEKLNADLRNSFVYSADKTMFFGGVEDINFFALADTFYEGGITRDYAFISYKLEGNKLKRLCLKNQEVLDTGLKKEAEEFNAEIEEITFNYGNLAAGSNEIEWEDSWNDPEKLPQAIKIKLTLKKKIRQDFERTIFLPL